MKKEIVCPVCGGRGHVSWINSTETSCYSGSKTCPHCNGTRWVDVDMTNADHIRSMTDKELAELLCTADWCEICDQIKEDGTCKAMEMDGPLNKHCVSAGLRWLKQPYEENP